MNRYRFPRSGLYAITREEAHEDGLVSAVRLALQGGAAVVQYRDKSPHDRGRTALRLLGLCRNFGVPLIINDDIELAVRIGADGVHLGRNDRSLPEARTLLGPAPLIGVSCYDSVEQAERAARDSADYVAFGRFFPSRTKPLASPARLDTLTAAKQRLSIPVVAIGGITTENGATLVAAGADLLAVVDAVFGTANPELAARSFQPLFTP